MGLWLLFGAAAPALAAAPTNNPILQYTMKAIGADVDVVTAPTKAQDPADVLDGDILAAITRSRTAAYQLQLSSTAAVARCCRPALRALRRRICRRS